MNKEKILELVNKRCRRDNVKLVYCIKGGSHLYGTDTETSDLDVKGIFLPSKESLLLGRVLKPIIWSTGDDNSKNTQDDMDVELFSIHDWFRNLKKGDTHALDLLFSYTNHDCIIYGDHPFQIIFENPIYFVDFNTVYSRVHEYAFGQAKKYGIKGSRMGVLKRIDYRLHTIPDTAKKLNEFIDLILDDFGDESYCFAKEVNGIRSLVICGKVHQGTISMFEFAERIHQQYLTYGERARLAEENQGIDWKACSHALRAAYQIQELLTTGKITFPIPKAAQVLEIKQGKVPWNDVERIILAELEALESLKKNTKYGQEYRPDLADKIILSCYKER